MIPALPEDIFVTIFEYLSLPDVISVRRVCRSFNNISKSRGLWISLLHREIWNKNIPTPQIDLDTFDAAQIENLIARSLSLHRNWTSSSPIARRQRQLTVATPRGRITSLHFLTLEGYRECLLSFALTSMTDPRTLTIECWELNSLTCIARRTVQWFGGYAVNSDPNSNGLMAIKTPHIEVLAFDPSAADIDSAFVTLITLGTGAKSVLSLTGTTMIFRGMNNEIKILDIVRPLSEVMLEDRQVNMPQPANQPDSFEAIVHDDYVVILRTKTLSIYPLDVFRNGTHPSFLPLSPVKLYEFPWRIDSCHIQHQISPFTRHLHQSGSRRDNDNISILIRYSSLFPWPVNLIHHYVLEPNPLYLSPTRHGTDQARLPISLNNLPYYLPPVLSQTVVSPVRLFAITDMTLGPYGTAVWLDSHTEDFYYHGEVGQRIAGLVLKGSTTSDWLEDEDHEDDDDDDDDDDDVEESNDHSNSNNTPADQNSQSTASIVFGAHETDDWNRLAIDEEHGRLAVGSVNGEIMINEYVD